MAFLIKNQQVSSRTEIPILRTLTHVKRATASLPQSTTEELFAITGGRILVHLLLGEVTTVIQSQTNNAKLTINPTTGTSGDVAANLDITGDEVSALYFPEGDATALIGANGGTGFAAGGIQHFIVPIGGIDLTCSASNTGAVKWDLWYEPLDELATVVAS
jgi:hypothetical protein